MSRQRAEEIIAQIEELTRELKDLGDDRAKERVSDLRTHMGFEKGGYVGQLSFDELLEGNHFPYADDDYPDFCGQPVRELIEAGSKITAVDIVKIERVSGVICCTITVDGNDYDGALVQADEQMIVHVREASREGKQFPELFEAIEDAICER